MEHFSSVVLFEICNSSVNPERAGIIIPLEERKKLGSQGWGHIASSYSLGFLIPATVFSLFSHSGENDNKMALLLA